MVAVKVILKIVIVIIILIIASVVFTTFMPSTTRQAVETVTSFTPEIKLQTLPCTYYCFATKTPEEKAVLEAGEDVMSLKAMPTYFSCNYQLLELATFAYESARYSSGYHYAIIKMNYQAEFPLTRGYSKAIYLKTPGGYHVWHGMSQEDRVGLEVYNDTDDAEQIIHNFFRKYIGWEVVDWDEDKEDIISILEDFLSTTEAEEFYDNLDFDNAIILKKKTPILKNHIYYDYINIPDEALEEVDYNLNEVRLWDMVLKRNQLAEKGEYAHVMKGLFKKAVELLFDCLNNDFCDDNSTMIMNTFCQHSPHLSDYHYISCLNPSTMKDRLGEFNIVFRNGTDIENDFVCTGEEYDACNVEMGKYGGDCQPAWGTLLMHEGRCEDIAILYYTIFRTLGVPDATVSSEDRAVRLETGVCDLPCPCKRLVEECGLNSELVFCEAPSKVIVEPEETYGEITICASGKSGKFRVTADSASDEWLIKQKKGGKYARYYLRKSFDDNDANDEYYGEINDGSDTIVLGGHSACEAYPEGLTKQQLITRCERFIENPSGFSELDELALCLI